MRRFIHGYMEDDVTIYLRKTGITDSNIISALRTFYESLKNSNLWNKIKVLYPMTGGTLMTCSIDLKAVNSNMHNLIYADTGVIIASSQGLKGDGNTFAYTNFIPSNRLTLSSQGYTICVGTDDVEIKSTPILFGNNQNPTAQAGWLLVKPPTLTARLNGVARSVANSTNKGIYSINRVANNLQVHKNEVKIIDAPTDGLLPTDELRLLAGATGYNTVQRIQTFVIHDGLSDEEAKNLHLIINTFENSLGRKTW